MNAKDKTVIKLKKCASTNELTQLVATASTHLDLREAKSYAGDMNDSKNESPANRFENNSTRENCLDLLYKDYDIKQANKSGIATKDMVTQEIFYVDEEMLNFRGRVHTTEKIAWNWKKDCRMWLWKNDKDFKHNRSVADLKNTI